MYDRWQVAAWIAAACFMLAGIGLVAKHWRKDADGRTMRIFAVALLVIVAVAGAALTPGALYEKELSHYDMLFHSARVVYDGEDVTELFREHANTCWDFVQMEEMELPKGGGTVEGTLLFYNEKGRTLQKIDVVKLESPAEHPRAVRTAGGDYVFVSADWESRGYVYGFAKELAEALLR